MTTSAVGYYMKDSYLTQFKHHQGATGMPSVTIVVSAGSGWSTA
jgi:hypothetical protein